LFICTNYHNHKQMSTILCQAGADVDFIVNFTLEAVLNKTHKQELHKLSDSLEYELFINLKVLLRT